jgi:hypothetical protein
MSKRLQVVVDDTELHEYEETAKVLGLTLSAWVRQNLRKASRDVSRGDVEAKLAAIRRAASYSFPAPDIEQMNKEIERGYLAPFDDQ